MTVTDRRSSVVGHSVRQNRTKMPTFLSLSLPDLETGVRYSIQSGLSRVRWE